MKKVFFVLLVLMSLEAKNYEIKMLDMDENGESMVFDPGYLHIEVGDSVTFLPTHKSHYVQSKVIPEGASHFLSELDEEATFTFDNEGIYIYVCPPHQMMSMIGIIQVGNAVNIQKVREMIPKLERRAMTNKERLSEYAKQIKE